MSSLKEHTVGENGGDCRADDNPLSAVPLERRQRWTAPALIFGGLECCVPALMAGAVLAASFSPKNILFILFVAFAGVQWAGNAINGYMGAKTGRASSVLARGSFGAVQARVIISLAVFFACIGWWSLQAAVAGNSLCVVFGIDYNNPASFALWSMVTIAAGVIFAAPQVVGCYSMKWASRVTVLAGLLTACIGVYLGQKDAGGFAAALSCAPGPDAAPTTFIGAMNIILGLNISLWVIAADYTRNARPSLSDNALIPLGLAALGPPLVFAGALMAAGQDSVDIVGIMVKLGLPFWGFIILWLSTWTAQLVNNYSMGLAFSSLLNVSSDRGRMYLTVLGTAAALAAAISGILDHFVDFLFLTPLLYAPIAGVMTADFFLRRGNWEDNPGWNWIATLALAFGVALGYFTTFVSPSGVPAIQCAAGSGMVYAVATLIKAALKPDSFTPPCFRDLRGPRAEISGGE